MNKLSFVFAIHNHQPVGNFDSVFEEVYQNCYKPFLDVLEKYPTLKVTQHYTGILLEWLQKNHPEFIDKLKELIDKGQIELLSGAYYEAILSVIPPSDRIKQIKKLSEYIKELFDIEPEGIWLAERIWEQQIVKEISEAGIKFLPIDEAHFKYAGVKEENLFGFYTTEEQGKMLYIFPGSKKLRYTIPFSPIEETINYFKNIAEQEDKIIVFADDGEKFGSWPKTFKLVYQEKWLEKFFESLEENSEWLKTIHFKDVIKNFSPEGSIYLPTASYPEMLEWSLPTDTSIDFQNFQKFLKDHNIQNQENFVKGGYWRNFLAKYPEVNWMHKRMLRVSNKILNYTVKNEDKIFAQDHLLASQCNDAYWHGVFGGLYLPNLRYPIYKNLIEAERLVDNFETEKIKVFEEDFDCDGKNEIIIESGNVNLFIKPDSGGTVKEFDLKSKNINLLNIINRKEEASHIRLRQDINEYLHYDWYSHASLVDHFFNPNTTLDNFVTMQYKEEGDFVDQNYDYSYEKLNDSVLVRLERIGNVIRNNGKHKIQLIKTIKLSDGKTDLEVEYQINNLESNPINLCFGVEWNYGLMAGDAPDRYYHVEGKNLEDNRLRSVGLISDVNKIALVDEWLGLKVELETNLPCEFWRCPIETVSMAVDRFEKIYQSSIVIPRWKFELVNNWQVKLKQRIELT